MKNMLTLGVLAVVCFTAAGALSIYLQKSPVAEETKEPAAGKKKKDKEKDDDIPAVRTTPTVASEETAKLTAELRDQASRLRDRENRLKVKEQQVELILSDIRSEREALDRIRGQISVEMKLAADKSTDLDKKFTDLDEQRKLLAKGSTELAKTRTEYDKDERTNIAKMAALYDAMAPENAAKIPHLGSPQGLP
jgi:chromosome segregation ATPase